MRYETKMGILIALCMFSSILIADTVINVSDYGDCSDSKVDATLVFQKAIKAVREVAQNGPVTLMIPPGDYHFFSKEASKRSCFFSNATERDSDGIRTIAIDLVDIDNLTLMGNDARLIMRGMMTMLVAENCKNLIIQNVEFDFQRPTFSEITVLEKGDDYWIGKVHAESTFRIVDGKTIQWFGEDWKSYHNMVQHYDPHSQTVRRDNDPTRDCHKLVGVENRVLRFQVPPKSLKALKVGNTLQFRNTRRNQCGIWFNRCKNITMKGVTVRAMHGFGILSQFTENITFDHLEVAPAPDSGRTCASPADILHFSGCSGEVLIANSTLTASHDDAVNVHGTHLRIVDNPSPKQLIVRFQHHQSWGFQAFLPRDEIELVRKDTLLAYDKAVVRSVEINSPYEQTLTLDREISSDVRLNSDAVENITWTPSVEISNCKIAQIPTRGFLFTTRQPILVRDCHFYGTGMHGILIENDASGWFESGPVHNLTLRENTFENCAEPVVHINPHTSVHEGPVHRDIRIVNNRFILKSTKKPKAIYARSVDGLKIDGNLFEVRVHVKHVNDLISANNTTNKTIGNNNTIKLPSTTKRDEP